jgi:hypothetical protein
MLRQQAADYYAPEAAQIAWGRTLRFIDSNM